MSLLEKSISQTERAMRHNDELIEAIRQERQNGVTLAKGFGKWLSANKYSPAGHLGMWEKDNKAFTTNELFDKYNPIKQ